MGALLCHVFNCRLALLSPFFFNFEDVFAPSAPVQAFYFPSHGRGAKLLGPNGIWEETPSNPAVVGERGSLPASGFPFDRLFLRSFGRGETPAQMSPDLSQGLPST